MCSLFRFGLIRDSFNIKNWKNFPRGPNHVFEWSRVYERSPQTKQFFLEPNDRFHFWIAIIQY